MLDPLRPLVAIAFCVISFYAQPVHGQTFEDYPVEVWTGRSQPLSAQDIQHLDAFVNRDDMGDHVSTESPEFYNLANAFYIDHPYSLRQYNSFSYSDRVECAGRLSIFMTPNEYYGAGSILHVIDRQTGDLVQWIGNDGTLYPEHHVSGGNGNGPGMNGDLGFACRMDSNLFVLNLPVAVAAIKENCPRDPNDEYGEGVCYRTDDIETELWIVDSLDSKPEGLVIRRLN